MPFHTSSRAGVQRGGGAERPREREAPLRQIHGDHVRDAAIDERRDGGEADRPGAEHHRLLAGARLAALRRVHADAERLGQRRHLEGHRRPESRRRCSPRRRSSPAGAARSRPRAPPFPMRLPAAPGCTTTRAPAEEARHLARPPPRSRPPARGRAGAAGASGRRRRRAGCSRRRCRRCRTPPRAPRRRAGPARARAPRRGARRPGRGGAPASLRVSEPVQRPVVVEPVELDAAFVLQQPRARGLRQRWAYERRARRRRARSPRRTSRRSATA